jgi:hypothetical protein
MQSDFEEITEVARVVACQLPAAQSRMDFSTVTSFRNGPTAFRVRQQVHARGIGLVAVIFVELWHL